MYHTLLRMRTAVIGRLAAAALLLMTPENFGTPTESPWQFLVSILLFLFAFIGQQVYKMNPILLLCICGGCGLLLM